MRFALESIIAEKADSQKLNASREKALAIREQEVILLCGTAAGCPTTTEWYKPKLRIDCSLPQCNSFEEQLLRLLGSSNPADPNFDPQYLVLTPVKDALTKGVARPNFSVYRGGALERLALNQFFAVLALQNFVAATDKQLPPLAAAAESARFNAVGLANQASAQLDLNYRRLKLACSICDTDPPQPGDACCINGSTAPCRTARNQAWWEQVTFTPGDENSYCGSPPDTGCIIDVGCYGCTAGGYNTGTMTAFQRGCEEAAINYRYTNGGTGITGETVMAALMDAFAKALELDGAVVTNLKHLVDLQGTIEDASAAINEAVGKANVAKAKADIDANFEQAGFATQLPLSRRYHHYDLWRARALLEDARRLSATARRAIEGRFAIDLSQMKADEPFVASPALWADEVYGYDLDAPSTVGLSVLSDRSGDGLYPNKLADYVRNLELFVRGYPIKRPTASAIADAEVLTIPGPEVKQSLATNGPEVVSGGSTGWTFQCKQGDEWQANPAAAIPGKTPINWSFSKNSAPPFENEGFAGPLNLGVTLGSVGAPAAAFGGNAVSFNGTSLLETPATSVGESLGGFTLTMWVNLRAYGASSSAFLLKQSGTGNPNNWISVGLVEDRTHPLGPGFWSGVINLGGANHLGVATTAQYLLPLNTWSQIGITWDGRLARSYKDGVLVWTQEFVTPNNPPVSLNWGTHRPWQFGSQVNGWIGPTIVDSTAYSPERMAAEYKKAVAYTMPSVAWQFKQPLASPSNDGCTAAARSACTASGCSCLANDCVYGSCPTPLDVSTGSAGPLPLKFGPGTGSVVAGQSALSGLPSIDFNGAKTLTTASTTTHAESPHELTLSLWAYVRNPTSGSGINFALKSYNPTTWAAPFASVELSEYTTGVRGSVTVGANGFHALDSTLLTRNKWNHLALTYDGTKVRLYVNGVQRANTSVSGPINWGNHGPWCVGGNCISGLQSLDGMIADVRIEPRARLAAEITDLYNRGLSPACYFDDTCVGTLSCCPERTSADSPLQTMCNGNPPERAKISFELDPWGRQGNYYANPPYKDRHNVRWGRMAVNLVGVGVRNCARAEDPTACYAESFLRYNLQHSGPAWVSDYDGNWLSYPVRSAHVEGGKALAIEEWIDPIVNGWNQSYVSAVQRHEFRERPVAGAYELELDVSRDVQLNRIERVQLLMETNYWVREQ